MPFSDHGEGFCLLNDFAIASNYLLHRKIAQQNTSSSTSMCTRETEPQISLRTSQRFLHGACMEEIITLSTKKKAILI
jgi:hypothetical protein